VCANLFFYLYAPDIFICGCPGILCTTVVSQLARHPDLSCYSDPQKRVREWLSLHKDTFEAVPRPVGAEKRCRLIKYSWRHLKTAEKAISGVSQRAEHWLGLSDIWIALTLAGGRPNEWVTELDGQFDAAFTCATVRTCSGTNVRQSHQNSGQASRRDENGCMHHNNGMCGHVWCWLT
jgi:hypothetical protein